MCSEIKNTNKSRNSNTLVNTYIEMSFEEMEIETYVAHSLKQFHSLTIATRDILSDCPQRYNGKTETSQAPGFFSGRTKQAKLLNFEQMKVQTSPLHRPWGKR